ncbi:hypothetical protein POVWA2_022420 [Plasmodium ovale wallikeri]|uniref:Uncharacterized protein n=1 Tax=Plasmodium ovale wallikeri TaxID=864142 RepID=A0A1A8YTE8_PLAOA|nr:hypothetical protein POVWA2_022420 [Plasmodium ovale wallikeri]
MCSISEKQMEENGWEGRFLSKRGICADGSSSLEFSLLQFYASFYLTSLCRTNGDDVASTLYSCALSCVWCTGHPAYKLCAARRAFTRSIARRAFTRGKARSTFARGKARSRFLPEERRKTESPYF